MKRSDSPLGNVRVGGLEPDQWPLGAWAMAGSYLL